MPGSRNLSLKIFFASESKKTKPISAYRMLSEELEKNKKKKEGEPLVKTKTKK